MTGHALLQRTGRVRRKQLQHDADTEQSPPGMSQSEIVALQHVVGNQGVQRMLAQGEIDSPVRKPSSLISRQTATEEAVPTGTTFDGTHTVLKFGATGKEVFFLQRRLNLFGAKLVEDGMWGNKTQAAVIEFQNTHQLVPDGAVGPLSWGELEKNPPNTELKKDKVEPGETPVDDPNKLGGFQNFVDQGVLSKDIARVLHQMLHLPGFGAEMSRFAHNDLSNGKLVGFVRLSEPDKIKNKLHSRHHKLLDDDVKAAAADGINAVTRGVPGESRSYILFKDAELDKGKTGQAAHDFVVLEIAHELTHHRNRVEFDRQASAAESPNAPGAENFFVDVARAKKFANTEFVRATFVDELVARHVAWHVDNDQKPADKKVKLQGGQFFKAALDFGQLFTSYNDNGYMKDLFDNAPQLYRQQVGQWLGEVVKRRFHSDPKQNELISAFMLGEFVGATFNGFAEPPVAADGTR